MANKFDLPKRENREGEMRDEDKKVWEKQTEE